MTYWMSEAPAAADQLGLTFARQNDTGAIHLGRLAVFCAVVERRGFTRAAEDLCLSQSAVSLHVSALEKALGARLFDRQRRGAHLTEAGEAVYDYAVTLLRETLALRGHLNDLAGGAGGVVTVGATMSPSTYILPGLFARFHERYPRARLHGRTLLSHSIVEEVLAGHLDFGIVGGPAPAAESLVAEALWREAWVVAAPRRHPLAERSSVSLADLAGQRFVGAPRLSPGDLALDVALRRAGLVERQVVVELGHPEAMKRAVLDEVGLSVLLTCSIATELATGELVALAVPDFPLAEQFLLVYRRAHRFSPLARNLLAFIRADVAEGRPGDSR